MHDLRSRYFQAEQVATRSDCDLFDLQRKAPFRRARAWKEHLHGGREPGTRAGRTRDHQRFIAPGEELGVKQKERQSAEMIAMQMSEDNPIDGGWIDAARVQRDHRGSAAI